MAQAIKICTVVVTTCNVCPHYTAKGSPKGHGTRKHSLCELLNYDPDIGQYNTPIPAACPLVDAPKPRNVVCEYCRALLPDYVMYEQHLNTVCTKYAGPLVETHKRHSKL